ncbi:MAG: Flp pilus assembly complex ATPase component TadA [Mariniblastus sp.]|nr:Flp pilus assembly complex ATPase component TadA [Mariniblastus sp.]
MPNSNQQETPPITFVAAGETELERAETLEDVLPSPGFPTVTQLVVDAIEKRSDVTVLDFTPQQVNIRFQIDNVWHTMPAMDRETGDYMLATLKRLAGVDYRNRRAHQEGSFRAEYRRVKHGCKLISQGVRTGERIALYVDLPKSKVESLTELGMPKSLQEQVVSALESDDGIVLCCGVPNEGYTSVWRGMLTACDRFLRDFYVIEEESRSEPEVINVTPVLFNEKAGETAFSPIPKLMLKEPNVIAFAEAERGEIVDQMVELSEQNIFVPLRVHGKHASDAVARLILCKPNVRELAKQLRAVLCMRTIRRLCTDCRQPFTPHPTLLNKLGLPAGSVRHMYKSFEYEPGMVDENDREIEPCPSCHGIGYSGLTGIFEVLKVGERFRQAMVETPHVNQLLAAARAEGHISIRETGVVAVAQGITSLEELQRVLKK